MLYHKELPELIRFGSGVRHELVSLLPSGAVLIVTGAHSRARIETELLPRLSGRAVAVAGDFPAEVPLSAVETAVKLGRQISARSIIGWGGGSAMDGAKAAAALLDAPASVNVYFYGKAAPEPRKAFLALLPTSAGTGAEVTANAVLHDPETGVKQSLRAPGMTADAALVDPELLAGSPRGVMAASGFDALTQALEGFLSRKSDSLTRQLALTAAKLILVSLERACAGDAAAFEPIARGSLLAGMGFASSGLGAVHGVGHPLGSVCHVSHGMCCAILLVPVLKFNLPAVRGEFETLAAGLGFRSPEALISEVERLRGAVGIPENFRPFGLNAKQYPFIVANCRSGSMRCNPRDFTDGDVIALLEELS